MHCHTSGCFSHTNLAHSCNTVRRRQHKKAYVTRRTTALQVCARNRILFQVSELHGAHSLDLALQDDRSTHLLKVLKVQPQDKVKVGVVNGPMGVATVIHTHPTVTLECLNWQWPLPSTQLHLVLAMPRPKVMKRLWSTLACLGVSRVYITGAEKVEKVYFASHALKPEKFCSELIRGAEQAGDTRLPAVFSKSLKNTLAAVQSSLTENLPSPHGSSPSQSQAQQQGSLPLQALLQGSARSHAQQQESAPSPLQQQGSASSPALPQGSVPSPALPPGSASSPTLPQGSASYPALLQGSVPSQTSAKTSTSQVRCLLPEGAQSFDAVTDGCPSAVMRHQSDSQTIAGALAPLAETTESVSKPCSSDIGTPQSVIKLLAHTVGGWSVHQAIRACTAKHDSGRQQATNLTLKDPGTPSPAGVGSGQMAGKVRGSSMGHERPMVDSARITGDDEWHQGIDEKLNVLMKGSPCPVKGLLLCWQ